MCRRESTHSLERTPLFNCQCSASSGRLDLAEDGRMVTCCGHVAVVCLSCCIDVDEDYAGSNDVTGSRDAVTDSVQQMHDSSHLLHVCTTGHSLKLARYSAI